MAWTNGPLRLYHGTTGAAADDILRSGIDLAKCKPRSDFGRGFYMTRNATQARSHANQIFKKRSALAASSSLVAKSIANPICAAVMDFEIDLVVLSALRHLAFVSASSDWVAFVQHCRSGALAHVPSANTNYDIVYGPMAGLDGRTVPTRL